MLIIRRGTSRHIRFRRADIIRDMAWNDLNRRKTDGILQASEVYFP